MRRPALASAFLFALASSSTAAEVVVDGRAFRVPDGFTVEKVAGPPLVDRPIVADFDEQGRLYAADSSGSNDNVKKQEVEKPHRIVRLEDIDGDGKFDRSTVFADKMMFPEGAMWLDGSLYVAAPPSIWKLTDTDGDGMADRREEWFKGKTLTGCANDLHGPYPGPDGRIYWCKGAFAPQTYERPGRPPLVTRAAHIFRAKPDGSEIEPVMTGGMDNPVDVAFTAEGERIFTTTFLQHPGGGKRDGLIHALYGGVYGKAHDVIDGHPRTGPDLLPPLVHLGPAAPAGLARAESDALGSRDCLFTACFNLRKVARTRLKPAGAAFSAETDDFLASDDLDFHPTDVQEDADGSLIVVDTGGWYKICCPTSQLVKPDVLGAIYRVRRKDEPKVEDPRGLKLDWPSLTPEALASLLDDPRPAVSRRAVIELARKGEASLPALATAISEGRSVAARRNALWAACRVDSPGARPLVRRGLDDPDPSPRQVAAHAAGLRRDGEAASRLVEMVAGDVPPVARAAAEALGRIGGEPSVVASLLRASDTTDLALRHSATYALIEIDEPTSTRLGVDHPAPLVRRAALVALDQMDGGKPTPGPVIAALALSPGELNSAAWWIAGRHPEWGDALASFFQNRLTDPGSSRIGPRFADLEDRLAETAHVPAIRDFIGARLGHAGKTGDDLVLLRAMARSGLKEVPPAWGDGLRHALESPDAATSRQAIRTVRALPIHPEASKALGPALLDIASRDRVPAEDRLAALAAIPGGLSKVEPGPFAFLVEQLGPDKPASSRSTAADVLARAKLAPDQYPRLAEALARAGPLEVGRLLDAFDRAEGEDIGLKLVEALQQSPARSALRIDALRPRLARFGPAVKPKAEALEKLIEADSADRVGHLEKLLAGLSGGDIRRGQAVFNGPKAACISCHSVGYVGGKLGPDLTKIGQVRSERDLVESIAYPSASFVRSYEPVAVATKSGKVVAGLLRKDSADEVIIAVAADRDERIARDEIEEMKPGTVSVMPAGLDRQLTARELADLIAFLRACR